MSVNSEKQEILSRLSSAVSDFSRSLSPGYIPGCGADIAFAKTVARDETDIASVGGKITAPGGALVAGDPVFGQGGDTAKILLTAMKFDPLMRSTAIIRCSPDLVRKLDELFFETCFFNPEKEPPGISTMDWGVASCCRNGVPDVIYNTGSQRFEPIARFFGEDPVEVVNSIIMVTGRIIDAH
ncbi:MAG TPA: thiamine-phosphate synthase family protein [Methanoregulaceae archaeon]|nr:thiamine-phosphate synthase family protein [Methanoregulaceae archaeon]